MNRGNAVFQTESHMISLTSLAEELDVPVFRLRGWESLYPFISATQGSNGQRFYGPESVALLREVVRLHRAGKKNHEIGDLLRSWRRERTAGGGIDSPVWPVEKRGSSAERTGRKAALPSLSGEEFKERDGDRAHRSEQQEAFHVLQREYQAQRENLERKIRFLEEENLRLMEEKASLEGRMQGVLARLRAVQKAVREEREAAEAFLS